MGFAVPGGMPFGTESGNTEEYDNTEDEDDELTVHHTASVGDVEVHCYYYYYYSMHVLLLVAISFTMMEPCFCYLYTPCDT
jgi:hypothetical protein